jgi:hypothetical protein
MSKLISVSSIVNFPEKPWLQTWIVKLMKGEYADWEKGTEPSEVRTEAQRVGTVFHLLVQKQLGHQPTPALTNAANKALLDEQIATRAYRSFDLWNTWYKSVQLEVEHVEFDVSDEAMGVSARCDALAVIDHKHCLCEWKTGNELHESDALEAAAYCVLSEHKTRNTIRQALLVHVPYNGGPLRVVTLDQAAIIHGASTFVRLLEAKKAWNEWNILCHTGLRIGA